jgi:hypothetical protein
MTASRGAATDWPRITLAYASDSRKDRNQVIQNDFMFHAVGAGCCRPGGAAVVEHPLGLGADLATDRARFQLSSATKLGRSSSEDAISWSR